MVTFANGPWAASPPPAQPAMTSSPAAPAPARPALPARLALPALALPAPADPSRAVPGPDAVLWLHPRCARTRKPLGISPDTIRPPWRPQAVPKPPVRPRAGGSARDGFVTLS